MREVTVNFDISYKYELEKYDKTRKFKEDFSTGSIDPDEFPPCSFSLNPSKAIMNVLLNRGL